MKIPKQNLSNSFLFLPSFSSQLGFHIQIKPKSYQNPQINLQLSPIPSISTRNRIRNPNLHRFSRSNFPKLGFHRLGFSFFNDGEDEEVAEVEGPRWYKIKNRLGGAVSEKPAYGKPESRTWTRQENWGRKTFKEGTESSVPKMVGEGVYGVGPVLAALSAGRREFYVLYAQEGLDLSSNNRKKKDKKGFERVLKLADKLGLSIKEVSKHDWNMIVDNRPHQGLVLDASPLEMVNIKELDPVSADGDQGLLWMALDEVIDP